MMFLLVRELMGYLFRHIVCCVIRQLTGWEVMSDPDVVIQDMTDPAIVFFSNSSCELRLGGEAPTGWEYSPYT